MEGLFVRGKGMGKGGGERGDWSLGTGAAEEERKAEGGTKGGEQGPF